MIIIFFLRFFLAELIWMSLSFVIQQKPTIYVYKQNKYEDYDLTELSNLVIILLKT